MDAWTQTNRAITVSSAFGKDVLLFHSLNGVEQLSAPYGFQLRLRSQNGQLDPNTIIGQPLCITNRFPRPTGLTDGKRYFHGIVLNFEQGSWDGSLHEYRAEIVPWFSLLRYTSDCRIFQQQSVVDIFEKVVKAHGFSDYRIALSGSYPQRDYCVQYRESDFDFLSRLLEYEGIYYYFEHSATKHTLVLCDGPTARDATPDYATVPFFPHVKQARRERDYVWQWRAQQRLHSGAYVSTDYDFKAPRKPLLANALVARAHAIANLEVFDWSGDLSNKSRDDAERITQLRIEHLACAHQVWEGEGNAADLRCGARFTLAQHPRDEFNQSYLLTMVTHRLTANELVAGGGDDDQEPYQCTLQAIPFTTQFRPASNVRKPLMHGAQSALVVGPQGEEIYTDEHGRVKVQFHWDRYGQRDEKSSCWMRVSSEWAGSRFGFIALPRIGQEVIVSFLEGDPDQPLITGRVYNGDNCTPYELPANKTQSGILTRSTPEGRYNHANALRFEDKKGAEELWLHAEKDQRVEVEHDESHWVGNDRTKTVDHDEQVHIKHDRTERVDNNESVSIGGFHTELVELAKAETIYLAKALTIGAAYQVSVGAGMNTTVALAQGEEVGLSKNVIVGKKFYIQAGDEFEIVVGKSSLVMKSDGTVLINGTQFNFSASGPVQISGKDVDVN
jgi:type VI secretion system secreted protein VgrG